MDLASVVAALASVGVRVSGSAPNSSVQVNSSRACPPGLAGPEPSGTINDLGQHFHCVGNQTQKQTHKKHAAEGRSPKASFPSPIHSSAMEIRSTWNGSPLTALSKTRAFTKVCMSWELTARLCLTRWVQ